MIALDTNIWIRVLRGDQDAKSIQAAELIRLESAVLLPMVLSEILSESGSEPALPILEVLPILEILPGYWVRAGQLRASMHRRGLRPKLIDTLIAQMCIDHNLPLMTEDRDFRAFERHAGLRLA